MTKLTGTILKNKAVDFNIVLETIKSKEKQIDFSFYPYGILNNFIHLEDIFNFKNLDSLTKLNRIADIGAADGDLSFFLEHLGYSCDIIDFPTTNFNGLKGVNLLKTKFNSKVNIIVQDIDDYFKLPVQKYDLVFLLGILYHLKNPYLVLEKLSKMTQYLILSTRIAQFTNDGLEYKNTPLVYLLNPEESNNDSTNYWIFSEFSLKRILNRTGWTIEYYKSVGDIKSSNLTNEHDERAFVLLKSNRI